MCTTSLCNDQEYSLPRERPNNFLRKQLGPSRLPFDSVAQGEIENNYSNSIPNTGVNESTPGLQSSEHISATSILFLNPQYLSSQKQNISLPSPKIYPLSIINITTIQQNKNKTKVSTDTLYVDNSVTDLDTQHAMPTHHELPVTPRAEAINDDIKEDDETIFDDIPLDEDNEEDEIEPYSVAPNNTLLSRVPRQTQGEISNSSELSFKNVLL